jgi:hypothetical protein
VTKVVGVFVPFFIAPLPVLLLLEFKAFDVAILGRINF